MSSTRKGRARRRAAYKQRKATEAILTTKVKGLVNEKFKEKVNESIQ